ncbi:hypothetical protein SAMN04487884_103207 [Butyrivibrio fibrisolvens]|uniref:Uncharacterized protein n=1 Tax=Butyrivibrio fibrisolvens TaxID=831 RepID=A0A1H9MRS7_BUTFI|nr:hypothetical protein SAMN04487884_103207 [Butyrivibrio fibrisolvens]
MRGFCGLYAAFLLPGVFRYGCGLFYGSGSILLQNGKDGGAVKIVAQLPGGDGLCPVRREIGQPPPALLDGHTLPQQQRGKLVKAGGGGKGFPYGLPQLFLVRFKLGLPGRDTIGNHGGVLLVQRGLSLFLRPILPVGDAVLAAVQEVDLVKPLPVAHLHDFGFEVAQGSVGTSVLAAGFRVGWPVHVGQERHFLNPQAVYDDMHMNVAAVVMPVRVGADKGLVAGEMFFTELLPQRLRPVYGQAVVRPVPRVKADDVVVAFHIFPPLVFLIAEIGPHTRNGKILPAAVQRRQPVVLAGDKPAGFIKDGLHGKFVMLKEQVLFGGSVVGVFRVDMFECCQPRHLLSLRLHT